MAVTTIGILVAIVLIAIVTAYCVCVRSRMHPTEYDAM